MDEKDIDEKDIKEKYNALLKDDDFDRLDLGVKNPNIFEILKIAKNEIRHSNFLAWLLSPNQSHKLGFMFLKKFIREVCYSDKTKNIYQIDIERLDLIEAQIKREWKNIDILIELEKIVIAIENKTLSKEGENQLKRYKEIINQEYPDRAKIFVFLTPGRDIPKDKDNSDWETISYEFIVETLDEILTFFGRVLNPKVKNYIEDYKIVIEREFMETDDLTKLSIKIYENHKELFDFINERIPDNVNRLRKIMQSELPNMDWRQGSENKYYVRFYTDKIKDFIYIGPKKFGWKKGESFLFEFALDSSHNRIIFQTIISPCGELYNSKRLEEILQGTDGIDGLDKAQVGSWLINCRKSKKFSYEAMLGRSDDDIKEEIKGFYEEITPIVKAVEEQFSANKQELKQMKAKAENPFL